METRSYFGYRLRQRESESTVPFFAFYARVKDIKEWIGIKRVERSEEGTQRVLKETRKKAITRFVRSKSTNTIPNSIIVGFEEGKVEFKSLKDTISQLEYAESIYNNCEDLLDWGFIEFSFEPDQPDHLRPALIIDGQHRFYGLCDYEQENIPILVVALLDATLQEQAFQFIVINNKAVRVPTGSVKSIIANLDEDQLQQRLLKAGVNYGKQSHVLIDINDLPSSPFQNLLDWQYNRNGIKLVKLTAIEQSLRYLKSQFSSLEKDDDNDSLVEIFCAIWRAIKNNYPELWGKDNKFMKKVNINALNEFIVERLKFAWEFNMIDIYDTSTVESQTRNLIKSLFPKFWESEWSIKIQDNTSVRNMLKEDFSKMAENYRLGKPPNNELKVPVFQE